MTGCYEQRDKTDERTATESILKKVKWNGAALDVKRGFKLRNTKTFVNQEEGIVKSSKLAE